MNSEFEVIGMNKRYRCIFLVTPAIAAAIGAATIGAGAGIAGGMALANNSKKKAPKQIEAPKVPTIGDADALARESEKKRRTMIQRTGGKTILSSEYEQGTQAKSLLGE